MKYQTTEDFIQAVQAGNFTGKVIVDNDQVNAYEGEEQVCDFEDNVPEIVLLEVFAALDVDAERA